MYFNETSSTSGLTAGTAFTVDIDVQNFDNAAFHAVYSGLDAADATVDIQGSIDGSNFADICSDPTTFVATAANYLWNVSDISYNKLRVNYDNGSVTTGTINLYYTRKSRR